MGKIRKRKGVRERVWLRVKRDTALIEQDGRCLYCLSTLHRSTATADHFKARAKGGTNEEGNIVAACDTCNSLKGDMPAKDFMKMVKGQLPATYKIQVQALIRRLNKRTDKACKRIKEFAR